MAKARSWGIWNESQDPCCVVTQGQMREGRGEGAATEVSKLRYGHIALWKVSLGLCGQWLEEIQEGVRLECH